MNDDFSSIAGMSAGYIDSNSPLALRLLYAASFGIMSTFPIEHLYKYIDKPKQTILTSFIRNTDSLFRDPKQQELFLDHLKKMGFANFKINEMKSYFKGWVEANREFTTKKNILDAQRASGQNKMTDEQYKTKLKTLSEGMEWNKSLFAIDLMFDRTAMIKKAKFVATGAGLVGAFAYEALPGAVNLANRSICSNSGEITYKNDDDMITFAQYADVYITPCRAEINAEKFDKLWQLSSTERKALFKKSPALCKAYEEQGARHINGVINSIAEPIPFKLKCSPDQVTVPYSINGTTSQAKFVKEYGRIFLEGSFVDPSNSSERYDKTKFRVLINGDLSWGGVMTPNRAWGSDPHQRAMYNDPVQIKQWFGYNEDCKKRTLRPDDVESIQKTPNRYCAVAKEVLVAGPLIASVIEQCPEFGMKSSASTATKAAGTQAAP